MAPRGGACHHFPPGTGVWEDPTGCWLIRERGGARCSEGPLRHAQCAEGPLHRTQREEGALQHGPLDVPLGTIHQQAPSHSNQLHEAPKEVAAVAATAAATAVSAGRSSFHCCQYKGT